jgi:NAD(P)-dependent dehydrogenase (short-subunit alcohol dehydrogenase family)
MAELKGKTAFITGAGRGIGRATAQLFAREGADLILLSRTEIELEHTVKLCEAEGRMVYWRSVDLADLGQVDAFLTDLRKQVNRVDILINNASMFDKGPIDTYSLDKMRRMLGTNFIAPFYLAQQVIPMMDSKSGGAIVNISSLSGCVGPEKFPGFGAYNISKYALWGLTEILALENKSRNVRVNQISLGGVETAMFQQAFPHGAKAELQPEDVAEKILFLVSDDSGNMTGENVLFTSKSQV